MIIDTHGVSASPHRIAFFVLGFLFLALEVGRRFTEVPEGIPFAIAAVSLFYFGSSLQIHGVANLKRFRVTPRTLLWFVAVVAFWYSTVLWIWWSRRSVSFPLFLLNDELKTTLFFDWIPVLVGLGLGLEALAVQDRE